jgi:hypothetical protein
LGSTTLSESKTITILTFFKVSLRHSISRETGYSEAIDLENGEKKAVKRELKGFEDLVLG